MGERHPRQAHVVLVESGGFGRTAPVGDDVAVREHHALGRAGGAGGELNEGGVTGTRALYAAGARDVVQVVHQEGARTQPLEHRTLARLRREAADALECAPLGVQEGLVEPARDAQQLVTVLVADAQRHGHGHDAAENRRPEHVDELLVIAQEQDEFVAAPRADALQVVQDPERPLVELAERHLACVVLGFVIGDAAPKGAVAFDDFGERRRGEHQRRSSLMCRGKRVRRLIWASSCSGLSGTQVRR